MPIPWVGLKRGRGGGVQTWRETGGLVVHARIPGADPGFRRGGFVQEFRLENRSYPDVHDFSLRMQVIIAND